MKKCGMVLTIIICALGISMLYAADIQKNLSDNLLRMHIIANSNTLRDQGIKLSVRNRILKETENSADIKNIERIAADELTRQGAGYSVHASAEYCYVPEKKYKNISLPEGMYNCVRVVLGSGSGENWWCVAYPPLCFTEEMFGEMSLDGRSQLEAALDEKTLKTIVENGGVNFRFKIVEELQKLRHIL